jgi:hypothetical protein
VRCPDADRLRSAQLWGSLPRSGGRSVSDLLASVGSAHDVSDVQVHANRDTHLAAEALHARAFTVGRHIYLGARTPSPPTLDGAHLLEHELGHALGTAPGTGPSAGAAPARAGLLEERVARSGSRLSVPRPRPSIGSGLLVGLVPQAVETAEPNVAAESETEAEVGAKLAKATGEADQGDASGTPSPDRRAVKELNYAFVFTGGGYGQSAEAFIKRYYPEHRLVRATSIEAMFNRLFTDMKAAPKDAQQHLSELIIVTHANAAGGMKIPLTRGDVKRKRFYSIWDVDDLQEEFQAGLHAQFRQRRRDVVATLIDDSTRVIVRGCEFGQSDEAVEVLRSLMGGQPMVWAPKVFQGYETVRIGSGFLRTPEDAFDFLVQQDYLPPALAPAPDEDKRAYIARVFGLRGVVPTEFFVVGQQDHDKVVKLIAAGKGTSTEAEPLKEREHATIPSGGEFWNVSAPLPSDAELDPLPLREIAVRASALNQPYRPENAGMLLRLRDAWTRKIMEEPAFMDWIMEPNLDPLGGMPDDSLGFMQFLQRHFKLEPGKNPLQGLSPESYFGDSNILAGDAARFPSKTPHLDTFETEMLQFEKPGETQEAAIREFDDEDALTPPPLVEAVPERDLTPPPLVEAAPKDPAVVEAERRRAAAEAEKMRQARDFSKNNPLPPPEPPNLTILTDEQLAVRYEDALEAVDEIQLHLLEAEMRRRMDADPDHPGFGTALPRDLAPANPANAGVKADIALKILRNAAEGGFPWRPELGEVGNVAWFVTEGNPYVGEGKGGEVSIPVELVQTKGGLVFGEVELLKIFEEEKAALEPMAEAEYRQAAKIDPATKLNSKQRRYARGKFLETAAERRMWNRVGETIRNSESGVGEVVLQNSRFSKSGNGRFAVVRDASKIRIKGGVETVLSAMEHVGRPADPILTAAAKELAIQQRWAGRVRGVFRYGGKVLIVIGLVNDAYQIITAKDHVKEVVRAAGGWGGAAAAGAAFAAWYTPADVAGPWAWLGHGVGTLIAGGVGYFIGSSITTTIYELAVEDEDTEVPE